MCQQGEEETKKKEKEGFNWPDAIFLKRKKIIYSRICVRLSAEYAPNAHK